LFQWRFKLTSTNNNVGTNEIESLPFRVLDFKNKADVATHLHITEMVSSLLVSREQILDMPDSKNSQYIQRKIDTLQLEINNAVYALYDLLPEEIEIVERIASKELETE
jgi:hypothetical protein